MISQSGKAVDLSRDHKPQLPAERRRIESSGGFVCTEGLLNGELGVARAIGDYHIPQLKQLDAGRKACARPNGDIVHAVMWPLLIEQLQRQVARIACQTWYQHTAVAARNRSSSAAAAVGALQRQRFPGAPLWLLAVACFACAQLVMHVCIQLQVVPPR